MMDKKIITAIEVLEGMLLQIDKQEDELRQKRTSIIHTLKSLKIDNDKYVEQEQSVSAHSDDTEEPSKPTQTGYSFSHTASFREKFLYCLTYASNGHIKCKTYEEIKAILNEVEGEKSVETLQDSAQKIYRLQKMKAIVTIRFKGKYKSIKPLYSLPQWIEDGKIKMQYIPENIPNDINWEKEVEIKGI